jgi:hypothetical protein
MLSSCEVQLGWVISSCSHSCPPEVSKVMQPQQYLGAEWGALWVTEIAFTHLFCHEWKILLHVVNIRCLLPFWRKLCYGFLSPLAGFGPVDLLASGEHVTTRPLRQTPHKRWNLERRRKSCQKMETVLICRTDISVCLIITCHERIIWARCSCIKIATTEGICLLISSAFPSIVGIKRDIPLFRNKERLSYDLYPWSFEGHLGKYCVFRWCCIYPQTDLVSLAGGFVVELGSLKLEDHSFTVHIELYH